MSTKFSNKATTLSALTRGKRPECVADLTSIFEGALAEGISLREAYEKAMLVHHIDAHDGLNHGQTLATVSTDEQVFARLDNIVVEANASGVDPAETAELDAAMRYWYKLYRSWGGDVYLSYVSASHAVEQLYEETHDLDETKAIEALSEAPEGHVKEVLLRTFYSARNQGETVISSLRLAKAAGEKAQFEEMLFSALGGGNLN